MHEAALAQAAVPAPAVVLEMLLRPLSLGHVLLLSDLRLDASGEALPTAVLICCQTWQENLSTRQDRFINFKLWLWRRRIARAARTIPNYYTNELSKLQRYIEAGSLEFPASDVFKPDRGPAPRLPGTPFVLRLQQWLITHLRLSETEAWDYPFGLSKMRWAAHWEQEGGLDIYNSHDEQFDRFVAEQEAKGEALNREAVTPATK